MNWFRFYHDVLDDPKVQRLEPALFKAWVNLLCLASKADDRGHLPSVEDIAFALRIPDADAIDVVERLTERGLIDGDWSELVIHNWAGRQKASDNVTERVRKHRSGPTNNETLHETDTKRSGNGLEKKRVEKDTEQTREEEKSCAPAREPKPLPANGPAQLLVKTWSERTGIDPPNYGKSVGHAQQLVNAGVSPPELLAMFAWLAADPFWQPKGFDLGTCVSQLEKFRQSQRIPKSANGRASPAAEPNPFDQVRAKFGITRPGNGPPDSVIEAQGAVIRE